MGVKVSPQPQESLLKGGVMAAKIFDARPLGTSNRYWLQPRVVLDLVALFYPLHLI